jgi:phosphotransacetylase
MPLLSFDRLFQLADSLRHPLPIAVAGGADDTVLKALRTACDRGWITPLVAGAEADIRQTSADCGIALHGFTLVDASERDRSPRSCSGFDPHTISPCRAQRRSMARAANGNGRVP